MGKPKHATILCVSALVTAVSAGACGQETEKGSVHNQGTFKHAAHDMTTCAATLLQLIRPELHYFVGTAGEWETLAGASKDDIDAATWTLAARDSGSQSSGVKLLSFGASKADLDDAWGVIETCEKQH